MASHGDIKQPGRVHDNNYNDHYDDDYEYRQDRDYYDRDGFDRDGFDRDGYHRDD